jgi:hypothetical protein
MSKGKKQIAKLFVVMPMIGWTMPSLDTICFSELA